METRKEIGKLLKHKQKEKIYDTIGNRNAVRVHDGLTEYKARKKGRTRKMNEVWKEYKNKNTKTEIRKPGKKEELNTMREISLFIAMSLDGYIADSRGGVDWLTGQKEDGEMIDTYSLFIRDVDTVLMGWNTYHQIVTELSPEQWIYEGLKTYVFTHSEHLSSDEICFTDREPEELLRELRQQAGKKIWVCGGANLVGQLREKGMIDEYYISVIPTLLGSGIRLFEEKSTEQRLELVSTQNYNGIVELVYKRRKDPNGV